MSQNITAMDEALSLLQEIEKLGERIVTDRELIIEFDRRQNKDREALRGVERNSDDKVWLCFANMFVRAEKAKAKDIIQRDQDKMIENINTMRDSLKDKLNELRQLEGKQRDDLFHLKPLAKKELEALTSILPKVV